MEIRVTSNCNNTSNSSMLPIDHSASNIRSSLDQSLSRSSPNQGSPSLTGHSSSMGNPLFSANRILSKNSNGTIAMTSCPLNDSELQLYRVLQRSNLLSYYDTFICQGGDDVQQLCDAGEEEFLEIMALVGMASKPLHVRRLQKALQEWVTNPAMFQAPLVPTFTSGDRPTLPGPSSTGSSVLPLAPPPPSSTTISTSGLPLVNATSNSTIRPVLCPDLLDAKSINPVNLSSSTSPSPLNLGSMASLAACQQPPSMGSLSVIPSIGSIISSSSQQQQSIIHPSHHVTSSSSSSSSTSSNSSVSSSLVQVSLSLQPKSSSTPISNGLSNHTSNHSNPSSPKELKDNSVTITPNGNNSSGNITSITSQNQTDNSIGLVTNEYGQPASPISLTPVLADNQITRLAEAAENLVKSLPPLDLKLANNKKKSTKDEGVLNTIMFMPEDDPKRMKLIRVYAKIYGRFDAKRNPDKPLTLHEVSVNEAAAQICKHIPVLLTRRDELFPLARQVVRDSGYQYSKGHSRSQYYPKLLDNSGYTGNNDSVLEGNGSTASKRRRLSENDNNFDAKIQCTEEERSRRQGRLENIIDQLKTLGSQQKELKIQLQQARDLQNLSHINQVQTELEHISTQQTQLINEQSEINKQLRKLEKFHPGLNRGLNHSLPEDKGDTDDTDSQFSVYSNELSPCMSQTGHDDSPAQESSQNSDNFNRILPANKTGNHQVSNQLTRQLVQETLLDEGLRLIKEFTDVQNKDCDLTSRIKDNNSLVNNSSKDNKDNNNNSSDSNNNNDNHNSQSNGGNSDNGIDLRVKQMENGSPKSAPVSIQSTNW
ncbi:putative uncharacterized protein DDB_G0277255 isoform X2 [Tetranychus urticae]|uniref:NAB co-repressor domain-containing protein n=1 Tax=Tetranychus urticae TaxID=32264 RepID=T1K8N8_TETUR|nr:putative uncharacterized protein DDB_G0277255 isoform X2 [Tetranychus urticae]